MKNLNTKNSSAPKTTRHTGREIGLELRKTHFILGNHNPNFSSQYRVDYLEKNSNNQSNFTNPNLKKEKLVLGINNGNYVTSSMAQNSDLDARRKDFKMVHLDENLKNELRNSHFLLGNFTPNYQTAFQSQFYAKNNMNNGQVPNFGNQNKSYSHKMGNDKVEFISETHMKYIAPNLHQRSFSNNFQPKTKISTQELQNSHYVFGKDGQRWQTSNQTSFQNLAPVFNSAQKTIMHSKLQFGTEKINYDTTNKTSHPEFKSNANGNQQDASYELRKHSIILGNDDNALHSKISKNTQDYLDPKLINANASANKLDDLKLRQSNFGLGDPHQLPLKQYETTYDSTLQYNSKLAASSKNNVSFGNRPTIKVIGNGVGYFQSENQAKYFYKTNEISEKEIREMKAVINDIRGHHWSNGTNNGNYTTTNNKFYKFDYLGAKNASIPLSEEHKNDLRYSHYELGKGNIPLSTTHINSYLANNNVQKVLSDPNLKRSHIDFNPQHGNIKGKTVYMNDYTLKESIE